MRRLVSIVSGVVTLAVLGAVLVTATLIDGRPPRVERVSLSPTAGSDDVAQARSTIAVEFDEPVERDSVEQRLHIEPSIAGTVTWNGSIATFTPAQRWPPASRFTVRIDPGFKDLAGNAAPTGLDGWSFRTVG